MAQGRRGKVSRMSSDSIVILYIDDLEDDYALLKRLFAKQYKQVKIEHVFHIDDAKKWLTHHPAPDLILLDYKMPGGDGIHFARHYLSQNHKLEKIPRVLISDSAEYISVANLHLFSFVMEKSHLMMRPWRIKDILNQIHKFRTNSNS